MEECPICKNKAGFAFGTCIKCGYNYLEKEYHSIEVSMDTLKKLLDPYILDYLVQEHEKKYKDFYLFNFNN